MEGINQKFCALSIDAEKLFKLKLADKVSVFRNRDTIGSTKIRNLFKK
jgi:hypothetical protein